MADYSKEKVPDLKKLLQERGLVISGNKADLIARLQEDDSKKAGGAGMPSPSSVAHLVFEVRDPILGLLVKIHQWNEADKTQQQAKTR